MLHIDERDVVDGDASASALSWADANTGQPACVAEMPPALFFSEDPVENLRIRVTLKRQGSRLVRKSTERTAKAYAFQVKAQQQAHLADVTQSSRLPPVAEDDEEHDAPSRERQRRRARAGDSAEDGDDVDDGDDDDELKEGSDGEGRARVRGVLERRGSVAGDDDFVLVQEFEWQEKAFSSREVLYHAYHNDKGARHDSARRAALDKRYAPLVAGMLAQLYPNEQSDQQFAAARMYAVDRQGVELATKVDDDLFVDPDEAALRVTDSDGERLNPLARRIVESGLDRQGRTHHARDRPFRAFYVTCTVDLPDSANEIKQLRKAVAVGHEKVLCQVRAYENGTFDVRPDVGDAAAADVGAPQWHFFTSPKGDNYAFCVENVSETLESTGQAAHARSIEEQIRARELDLRLNRARTDFDPPPPVTHFAYNVFGEIVLAAGFDAGSVYLEFETHLPLGWLSHGEPSGRASTTHVSEGLLARGDSPLHDVRADEFVHHFNFPVELEMTGSSGMSTAGKPLSKTDIDQVGMIKSPTIYVQANSIDWWDRHRVLGYGYAVIPDAPGVHEVWVRMWRPTGTVREQVQRFFIGGAPSMQDRKQVGIPLDYDGSFVSRYGFQTETAGKVLLRLNTVRSDHDPDAAGAKGGGDSWMRTLKGVLAKSRKESARNKKKKKKGKKGSSLDVPEDEDDEEDDDDEDGEGGHVRRGSIFHSRQLASKWSRAKKTALGLVHRKTGGSS